MKIVTSGPVAALAVGILAVGLAAPAAAELLAFQASLDQAQTVPAAQPAASATAQAEVILNTVTNQISWAIDYVGLSGNLLAVHFHGPAPAGEGTGVQVDIGAVGGTDRPLIGTADITAEQAADLQAGLWYVNLHTELNRPGEIRGQLTAD